MSRRKARGIASETRVGYLFASPWLIGFVAFTLGPILLSFYYSFCRYDVLRPPMFVGFDNYTDLLWGESSKLLKATGNTLYYTILRIPLVIIGSLLLAMLVAQPLKGVYLIRTIYYMPSIISGVALSVIWLYMYNPQYGLINQSLAKLGFQGPAWLADESWSKEAIIMMGIWSLGGGRMIVFLAGLQGIPRHLYESAQIDGAGWWGQFRNITIPQMSGVLFLMSIVEVITSFQVFTEAYLMTRGGPDESTLFYNLLLYNKAFQDYEMGVASALAWLLFVGTLLVTILLFGVFRKYMYYESEAA